MTSNSNPNTAIAKLLNHLEKTGLLKHLNPDDQDLLDSLWLAAQMGEAPPLTPPQPPSETPNIPLEIRETEPHKPPSPPQETLEIITQDIPPSSPTPPHGFPFRVPAASAIQNTLSLTRALRRLRRKVPSTRKTVLDEDATACRIAESDIWSSVTKPERERWLTLELVIEESKSSFIWRELVNELENLLEIQGAFQNIRFWQLSGSDNGSLSLVRRRKKAKSSPRNHSQREILHSSRRGLILIVSDCLSPLWQQGLIYPWLKEWSEHQPSAILQLFPESLWSSTHLRQGRKLLATASTPALPNPKLRLKNYPQWLPIPWSRTLIMPVITLEPQILKQWAGVVSGVSETQVSSFMFDIASIQNKTNPLNSPPPEAVTPDIQVRRYLNTASEPAIQLATLMAAAPVNMSVVNLIRKSYASEITILPVHVAEFYMGGLIKPISEDKDGQYRVYDFLPGIRKVLNTAIGSRRTTQVLDVLSHHIAEELHYPIRSFEALLTSLSDYTPEDQEKILPFAQVSLEVLGNLGGKYSQLAQEIRTQISKPPSTSPTATDTPPSEPLLDTCTFTVATLEIERTRTVEFVVATVAKRWRKWVINRQTQQGEAILEDLGGGIELELMEIPAGTFWMGTDDNEIERLCQKFEVDYFRREKPQHLVTVPSFGMGRYPITQAQWKAIAQRTDLKVNLDLELNPSRFQGENRPVERVNWYQAKEFCDRLSQLTEKNYRLPTEAEWEYACRGQQKPTGKSVQNNPPFHFGETIMGELANYDATYIYADEPKGKYRRETTPVGYFQAANAFGLYDMHGNVWEWCEDDYHADYEGAPTDGRAWLGKGKDTTKILRGGSWVYNPYVCRCAYRDYVNPRDYNIGNVGFRVVRFSPQHYVVEQASSLLPSLGTRKGIDIHHFSCVSPVEQASSLFLITG